MSKKIVIIEARAPEEDLEIVACDNTQEVLQVRDLATRIGLGSWLAEDHELAVRAEEWIKGNEPAETTPVMKATIATAEALRKLGIKASSQAPGYIEIPLSNGTIVAVDMVEDQWIANIVRSGLIDVGLELALRWNINPKQAAIVIGGMVGAYCQANQIQPVKEEA